MNYVRHRFTIQAWKRGPGTIWIHEGTIAECDDPEAVGVALVTLTADGEFSNDRKAAVWDRDKLVYVGGPPW